MSLFENDSWLLGAFPIDTAFVDRLVTLRQASPLGSAAESVMARASSMVGGTATMEVIKFGSDDLENRLAADPSRAELLPFGAIMVNQQGDVLRFNHVESGISGHHAKDVVGKNFFNDIAPCAKGQVFYNHFFRAVADGEVNTMFDYHFDYKMQSTNVRIHMKSADATRGIWIFIKRV